MKEKSWLADQAVIVAGLVTTAMALGLTYLIAQVTDGELDLMGLYVWFVVPVGALIVGAGAGSGFGLASFFTGIKIEKTTLWLVLISQFFAYWGSHYLTWQALAPTFEDGGVVPFHTFFDYTTRTMGYAIKNQTVVNELGVWGYALRLAELGGFVVGGVLVPLAMRSKRYCESCGRYMRTKPLVFLPAVTNDKEPKKKDTAAVAVYQAAQQKAWDEGHAAANAVVAAAQKGDVPALTAVVAQHGSNQKAYQKLAVRIAVYLSSCQRCFAGYVDVKRMSGKGQDTKTEDIANAPAAKSVAQHFASVKS